MTVRKKPTPTRPLTDDEGEVRELTAADMRRFRPISEVDPRMPEAVEAFRRKAGRPKADAPKVNSTFRLAPDLVRDIKATGRGYGKWVERVLRDALDKRLAENDSSNVHDARKTGGS